jgi:O-antigen/teichoic acid export membrane protein
MPVGVLRGFVSILGSKVITLLLGLLITPILVRLLGSALYGDYAFVLSLLGITMILVNAGIFDGTRKYIAENRDRSQWAEQVFGFYLRVATVLALTAAFGYAIFSWLGFSERFLGNKFGVYFYLLGGLILSRQAYSLARGGLMGLGLEEKSEPLKILKKILFGVIGLLLAYIGHGVVGVLVGQIIASFTVSALAFAIIFRNLNVNAVFSRIYVEFPKRELLSFNGLSVVLILLTASLYHIDILLLKPLAGSQATGYYRAALVIAEFLWFVPNALQTVFLHSSSKLWSNGETEKITMLVSKATRYNLSLTLLLALGLAALAPDFVPLYFGTGFDESVLPLFLLLPGTLGFALARPIFAVGQGKGELRVLIIATGTAALMNLVMNLLLIPRYGMAGAAIATSTSYGSMVIFHIWAARQIGFDPIDDIRLLRISGVVILAAPVIFGVALLIDSPIISLLVVPPVGFVAYTTVAIKLGVVSLDEFPKIRNRLPVSTGE